MLLLNENAGCMFLLCRFNKDQRKERYVQQGQAAKRAAAAAQGGGSGKASKGKKQRRE